jgi:hypothetical protein
MDAVWMDAARETRLERHGLGRIGNPATNLVGMA